MFKRLLAALKIVRGPRTTDHVPKVTPSTSRFSIFRTRPRKPRPEPIPSNIAPSIYYSIVGTWHEIEPAEVFRERLRKLYDTPEEGEKELEELDQSELEELEEREIREVEKREIKEVEERHIKQREERESKKRDELERKKREGEKIEQ